MPIKSATFYATMTLLSHVPWVGGGGWWYESRSGKNWKARAKTSNITQQCYYIMHRQNKNPEIGVVAKSFTKEAGLVARLQQSFPKARLAAPKANWEGTGIAAFLQGCQAAIIGRERLGQVELAQLKTQGVECIAKYGVGLDNIDCAYAKSIGLKILQSPGANRHAVAELSLCFLLGLAHQCFQSYHRLQHGLWKREGGQNLREKTVGILGCGNIGSELARLLEPLGCQILVNDTIDKEDFIQVQRRRGQSIQQISKTELYCQADFISIHLPLTPQTYKLIDAKVFGQCKKHSYWINTSRGDIVCERSLKEALQSKQIAGAALDVLSCEPVEELALLDIETLMLTPHIGGASTEARWAMGMGCIQSLEEFYYNKDRDTTRD